MNDMAQEIDDLPFPESQEIKFSIKAKREAIKNSKITNGGAIIGAKGANDRDEEYTVLLEKYIRNYQDKQKQYGKQRNAFFIYACIIMGGVLAACLAILLCLIFVKLDRVSIIVSATASVATILTTLIGIPLTITKHLFPQEMDHEIVDIVKSMIVNDCEIRKIQSDHDCKTCNKKNK